MTTRSAQAAAALFALTLSVLLTPPAVAQGADHTAEERDPAVLDNRVVRLIEPFTANHDFAGSVLVARGDSVFVDRAFGLADVSALRPNTVATKFGIGSITKQFTAAAILVLEAENKLSTADTVSRYLPLLPNARSMTIHHLLAHQSGLCRDPFPDWTERRSPRSLTRVIDAIAERPAEFEPGERTAYSNCGFIVLAGIVESVAGQPYADFLRDRIFEPLGLFDTSIRRAGQIVPDIARGYDPGTSHMDLMETPFVDASNTLGAGGMVSTVHDLFRWNRALTSGAFLTESARTRMVSDHGGGRGYGVGLYHRHGRRVIGHDGVTHGFTAFLEYYPEEDVTVIYAGNIRSGAMDVVRDDLVALTFGEPISGYVRPVQQESAPAPDRTGRLTGRYKLFEGFYLTISRRNGHLMLEGTGGYPTVLYQTAPNTYFYRAMYAYVRFDNLESGAPTLVWIDRSGQEYPAEKIDPSL